MCTFPRVFLGFLLILGACLRLNAQTTTAFTYQGRLTDGGQPANGTYDLALSLYTTNLTGTALGTVTNAATTVTNGLFTVAPNFGPGVFAATNYWLQIAVRTNLAATFVTLTPRQPITPTPLAQYATTAGNALTATTAAVAGSANSVAATNISGVLASAALPYATLSNLVAAVAAPWTNQVTGSNVTAVGAVTLTPEVWAFTNGTYYAGGVWYHATNNVIQEAIDHLPYGGLEDPGGGVVILGPGVFYVNQPVNVHQTNPFTFELRGQGQTASGIVGTFAGPVLSLGNTNGTRLNLEIDHLFCASTVNTFTNLIEIGDITPVGSDAFFNPQTTGGVANFNVHDCYFGPWAALTNNASIGFFLGFATPSTGVESGFTPRLVPLWVQTVLSDNYTIRNCHFFETAAIYLAVDHVRIENNNFYFMGEGTDWPSDSPFSLQTAIVFGHYNPNEAWFTMGNHFYYCGGGIYTATTAGHGVSMNDFYESCGFSVGTTPDSSWTLLNVFGAGSTTISDYPSYSVMDVPNPAIVDIKLNQLQTGATFSAQPAATFSVADGNVAVTGTRYPVQFHIFSGGAGNANGVYTRAGSVWTNAAGGTHLKYNDTARSFEIYSNRTKLYGFSYDGGNFDGGFNGRLGAGPTPVPYCVINSALTNVAVVANGTYYGDGSGLTNLHTATGLNTNFPFGGLNGVTNLLCFTNGILQAIR